MTIKNNSTRVLSGSNISQAMQFFKDLFSDEGFVEIRCIKDGKIEREWFATSNIEGLIDYALKKSEEGFNVYFGVAARKQGGGTKNDLIYSKAVWVDIDCKNEKDKSTVLSKLLVNMFVPTYIIDSGHGFHAYWILKEPVNDFALIERINIGLANHFKGDKAAHDSARILRCPETVNYKDQPLAVKIVHNSGKEYDLLSLQEQFEVNKEEIYDTSIESISETECDKELVDTVIKQCAFLKHCKAQSKTLPEPEWYAMVTNLVALGAYEKIHELSKDYDNPPHRYSKEETDKKIEHAKKDAPGPHTCQYIQKTLGFNCDGCEWKNRVKAPAGIAFKLKQNDVQIPFEVLGFTVDMDIIVYYQGEFIEIPTRALTREALELFTLKDQPYLTNKDYIALAYKIRKIASERGPITSNTVAYRKMGIWDTGNGVLILTDGNSYVYKNGTFEKLSFPKYDGKLIEPNNVKWLDIDRLQYELYHADLASVYNKLYEHVLQWNFDDPEGDMPRFITAYVMLAPFQQLMKWRPWIYLSGKAGTGKTTFFTEVLGIYGELVFKSDNTSAHALMQEVGSTSRILILDEFETQAESQYDQIRLLRILDSLKSSSSSDSGNYSRGTTSDSAKTWKLNHMPWLGSIYVHTSDWAQKSRTVRFELKELSEMRSKEFRTFTKEEKFDLAHKIVACVLKHWDEIERKATYIRQHKSMYKDAVRDLRMVDNLAYAMALLELINPDWVGIPQFVQEIKWEDDETELMMTILNSEVETPEGEKILSQLLAEGKDCEEKGVKWVRHGDELYLALDPAMVARYLLKDLKGIRKAYDIETMLKRISGAREKVLVRINGVRKRLYLLSEDILTKFGVGANEPDLEEDE